METLKYKNAKSAMYCDGDGCRWDPQGNCNIYVSHLKPCNAGYETDTSWPNYGTPSGSDTPGRACWAGQKLRVCRKRPNDPYWDPLPNKISQQGYTPANLEKAEDCCSNTAYTSADKEECGTLYWDGSSTLPQSCNAVLKKWCSTGDNILDPKCTKYIKNDNENYFKLKTRCASKKPGDEGGKWDDICACYYPASFYMGITKSLGAKWDMPPEYANPLPQCVYPQCKLSSINPDPVLKGCGGVSFTSCIQNLTVDASGSAIGGSIKPEMQASCAGTFKLKDNTGTNEYKTPEEIKKATIARNAVNDEEQKLKLAEENASKNKQMMIVAVIFIVIVIFIIKKKSAPVDSNSQSAVVKGGKYNNNIHTFQHSMLNSY
jgi:hypothetical protein